jgi:hypothetical protein
MATQAILSLQAPGFGVWLKVVAGCGGAIMSIVAAAFAADPPHTPGEALKRARALGAGCSLCLVVQHLTAGGQVMNTMADVADLSKRYYDTAVFRDPAGNPRSAAVPAGVQITKEVPYALN